MRLHDEGSLALSRGQSRRRELRRGRGRLRFRCCFRCCCRCLLRGHLQLQHGKGQQIDMYGIRFEGPEER